MMPAEILVLDIQDTETVCTSDNNFSESAWNSSSPLFNFWTLSLIAMSSGDFVPRMQDTETLSTSGVGEPTTDTNFGHLLSDSNDTSHDEETEN